MFSVHYIVLRGFYAIEDTRTPFFIQCVISAVNIVLAITLTQLVSTPSSSPPRWPSPTAAPMPSVAWSRSQSCPRRLGGLGRRSLVTFVLRVCGRGRPPPSWPGSGWRGWSPSGSTCAAASTRWCCSQSAGPSVGVYLIIGRLLRITEIGQIASIVVSRAQTSLTGPNRGTTRLTMSAGAANARPRPRTDGRAVGAHLVEPGAVLADRYVVEDLLAQEGASESWRARDHFSPAPSSSRSCRPSPRRRSLLAAAKRASRVTDSRILQVLDAADDGEPQLHRARMGERPVARCRLREGPMAARRADLPAREVASAMSNAHRAGSPTAGSPRTTSSSRSPVGSSWSAWVPPPSCRATQPRRSRT